MKTNAYFGTNAFCLETVCYQIVSSNSFKEKKTLLICIAAIESVLSPQIGCISYFDINRHLERVSSRLRDVCIYTRTCLMFYDLHRERLPTIGLYHILNLPFCGFE